MSKLVRDQNYIYLPFFLNSKCTESINIFLNSLSINADYKCKEGAIHVSGLGAVSIEGTSCTTFVDKDSTSILNSLAGDPREKESFFNESNNSFVNSSGDLTTEPCDIKCEAHNCIYNVNKECHVENVKIDSNNAYCNSFDYGDHI